MATDEVTGEVVEEGDALEPAGARVIRSDGAVIAGPETEGRMQFAELVSPPDPVGAVLHRLRGKTVTLHTVDGGGTFGLLESDGCEDGCAMLSNGNRTYHVPLHMVAVVEV